MHIPSRHSLIDPRNPSFLKISSQKQPKKVGLVLFWMKCNPNIQNMSYSIKARSSRDMASSNPWRTHSTTSYPFMKVSWMISKVHHDLPRKWIQPKKLVPKWYQIRKKARIVFIKCKEVNQKWTRKRGYWRRLITRSKHVRVRSTSSSIAFQTKKLKCLSNSIKIKQFLFCYLLSN